MPTLSSSFPTTSPSHPALPPCFPSNQEVFPHIPGDTDYRVFTADFDDVPGLDIAFVLNGYVYHTVFDTPQNVMCVSLQGAVSSHLVTGSVPGCAVIGRGMFESAMAAHAAAAPGCARLPVHEIHHPW